MTIQSALIVDDSKLARVTLSKKLSKHGVEVDIAGSAAEAFELIEKKRPEIIFMDHLMPEMDGFEATQKIRTMPGMKDLPIIMCTGKDHDGYLDEALAIGANSTLAKPPTEDSLKSILSMDFNIKNNDVIEVPKILAQPESGLDTSEISVQDVVPETQSEEIEMHLDEVMMDLGDIDIPLVETKEIDGRVEPPRIMEEDTEPSVDISTDFSHLEEIQEVQSIDQVIGEDLISKTETVTQSQMSSQLSELELNLASLRSKLTSNEQSLDAEIKKIEQRFELLGKSVATSDVQKEIQQYHKQQLPSLTHKFSIIKQKLSQYDSAIKKLIDHQEQINTDIKELDANNMVEALNKEITVMKTQIEQLNKSQRVTKQVSFMSMVLAIGALGYIISSFLGLV